MQDQVLDLEDLGYGACKVRRSATLCSPALLTTMRKLLPSSFCAQLAKAFTESGWEMSSGA